jgi:Abnormal spindle-like microcephaly-assoc'd, ASPM-SPD-2-Hydin
VTTKFSTFVALLVLFCLALPAFSQQSPVVTRGPIVIREYKHDTGPMLREVEPLLPEFSAPTEHEIQNFDNPNHNWRNLTEPDPVLQTSENSPTANSPSPNLEFEGLGFGSKFFCNCEPPDNDGAPGIDQYTQYINISYAVFDKSGNTLLGPLSGNAFWSGFGGSCQTDNSGDPIVRFDAAAGRWVVSQFAINGAAPDFECVAVSQTSDATGAYNRYAFPFNNFPDYPKMGVWPDAYYFTFNNFTISGSSFVGANACAMDRSKMLTGAAATAVCFQQNASQFGEVAADLDGPTPPAAGTPNFVMELDPSGHPNLAVFQFHVDFVNTNKSTFTGPTLIPVAAFTPLCNTQVRGRCVPQPAAVGIADLLESLGNRVMYRLVYRNFGDHTTLLASHSIAAGNSGGVRWYELRNPETGATIFQSGTFAPDTKWRWMPAIAMDKNQDIAIGYTLSGSGAGQFPSLVYAGRTPTDPAGTLEAEVVLKAGAGSQTGGGHRWGDYSSMTIDPADDCTFWFSEEYQKASGGFDWSTAIGNFRFPGCGASGGPFVSLSATSLKFAKTPIGQTTAAQTITLSNVGASTLNIASITSSGDFSISNNTCGATVNAGASCDVSITFTPTKKGARSGTLSFTDNAPGSPQTVALSGMGQSLTLSPTSLNFGTVAVGVTSASQPVTVHNASSASVTFTGFTLSGTAAADYLITANTCGATIAGGANCSVSVALKPTTTGKRAAKLNVKNNGGGTVTASLTGTGS